MLAKGQAAKLAGVCKATLSQAIESAKGFTTKNNSGGYDVDATDMSRGCPAVTGTTGSAIGAVKHWLSVAPAQDETAVALARAEANIDGLLAQLEQMHEALLDTRNQRDKWPAQAEVNQKLIADMRPARRGWLRLKRAS